MRPRGLGRNSGARFHTAVSSPSVVERALAKVQADNHSALRPDMERRREPLESYPLDSMSVVGMLKKSGIAYAVIQVDKLVVPVKVGNYLGQNFGLITNISDTEVIITERIQDAGDEWVERKTTLELQETKK